MLFQREIGRLLIAFCALFGVIALAAAYWAVYGGSSVLQRADNPRQIQAQAAIKRGAIFDRNERLLAYSAPLDDSISPPMARIYPQEAAHSALGYFSLRYGASGVEAAFDAALRGAEADSSLASVLEQTLVHRPPAGSDIMLTLDLGLQQTLAQRFSTLTGAAVVIDVPTGEVLAMISQPTINPNSLDADWETLVQDAGNPFYNRVVQARYQPGGALETALMGAALLADVPMQQIYPSGATPLPLGGLALRCAMPPTSAALQGNAPPLSITLVDAYRFGCPRPFATLDETLDLRAINSVFTAFQFTQPISLDGYALAAAATAPVPTAAQTAAAPALPAAVLLGQGPMLISPLQLAQAAAGIANNGDAPPPRLALALREPGGAWHSVQAYVPTVPVTTRDTATALALLMREAAASGAAAPADAPAQGTLYAHVSLAYTGQDTLVWYTGFVETPANRRAAIALVIEGSADVRLAAQIGADILGAAASILPTLAAAP